MNEKAIIETYKENKSLTKTAKIFNTNRAVITKIIKNNGIEIINYQNMKKVNENYFDNIDCENKAYWLGFIFADGNVSDENRIEIGLHIDDFSHLEKFKKDIEYVGEIKNKKGTNSCRITFRNKKLVNTLKKYGVCENKSKTKEFPKNIPNEYIKDFVRGYFDGNGSIIKRNRNNEIRYSLGICSGSEKFLTDMLNEVSFKYTKLYKDKRSSCYYYEWRKDCKKHLEYLYKDSEIYLDRKYSLYKEVINNAV